MELVREHAWSTWNRIRRMDSMSKFPLALPDGVAEQKGGEISPELVAKLRPRFESMPEKRK